MLTAKLVAGRTGLFAEHEKHGVVGGFPTTLRMTVPARERLEAATTGRDERMVFFARPPAGIVVVLAPVPGGHGLSLAVRCDDEPEYPGEVPNTVDSWLPAMLTPCPACGAALVWYEAGYVPGYRVCAGAKHHHVRLS